MLLTFTAYRPSTATGRRLHSAGWTGGLYHATPTARHPQEGDPPPCDAAPAAPPPPLS